MRILVFSDTHGRTRGMLRAIQNEAPDLVFHLGDNEKDALSVNRQDPVQALLVVCGNCDHTPTQPEVREVTLEGVKVYATHGHRQRVKYDLDPILNTGHFAGADVVLFGHTHSSEYKKMGDVTLFNPGSVGRGRRSYGLIFVKGREFRCSLHQV